MLNTEQQHIGPCSIKNAGAFFLKEEGKYEDY